MVIWEDHEFRRHSSLKLKIVSDYAIKKKKLAAFTETGLESIPDTT